MDGPIIAPNDLVIVTKTKHIVEVQYMEKMNTQANIKKIDKHRYVDLSTGEIREFEHIENRQQSYNSLRQTFKKLRYLINNNLDGAENELHCVLTYAENMTDTKRLYSDIDKFLKRLRYKYGDVDYINVPEPQGRGAWHNHMLLRFNDRKRIFIPNSKLADLWGHGFVQIKSLKNIDNIGAYLSAYLSDIELTDKTFLTAVEEKREVVFKSVEGKEKKFIKGGRLHMYPPGMNIIRKSKGMKYPDRKKMKYKNIKKIVGNTAPHYSKNIKVEKGNFENNITYEQYNTKR